MEDKCYICIDLKSFYASVECVERGLDPMTTDLVVADPERGDKTICLAVSPSLKKKGVKNRCRVFEIPSHIHYIKAPPRMQKYIDYAASIYGIYLRYFSFEDVYVYSIDEAFLDVTGYLARYKKTPKEMAVVLMDRITDEVGVRATAGIGTNLYLCKIALDINAKHAPDFIGVLDEESYREKLWDHKPLSDFWRIGRGIEARLARFGIFTMRQIAHAPEDLLYKEFGIDAELLIDHAWGRESVTMRDIQAYKPKNNSICSGQVLFKDYPFDEALVVVKEMGDDIALQLSRKKKKAAGITLGVGMAGRSGGGGRHMSYSFPSPTQNDLAFRDIAARLFVSMVGKDEYVRRFMISLSGIVDDNDPVQLDLFLDNEESKKRESIQKAILSIKDTYGKNAILKGMDYEEGATQRERNVQIGGHKSGV
ncbi:MAG: DNA methylase [Spirochaetales bacterium]|nr:DNA methylase [Spirochaetales bacterium]